MNMHTLVAALCAAMLAGPALASPPAPPATVATPTATTLPGNSLYHLDSPLTDSSGQRFTLAQLAGSPWLVSMFYGNCRTACPIVIETLKRTMTGKNAVPLRVLLISLDPVHDTPASLAMLADMQQLDPARYRLAVAPDAGHTRALAAALKVKYRQLQDGSINHSPRIVLLDADGTPQGESLRLDVQPDPVLLQQIASVLRQASR